jgi:enoyl-CoA hydratase/carnithine racemase
MSDTSALETTLDDGVLRIVKSNPEAGYGITIALWQALTAAFERAIEDDAVRAIVVDAGGKGFHRGAVMATELRPAMDALTGADFRDLVQRGQALGRLIASVPKPVIGLARGGALGGGLELLLRCDFVYTLDNAWFSFPEVTLGFVAAWGGTQWAGRMMPFRQAQELLLLGDRMSGKAAAEMGLVTRSFGTGEALDAFCEAVLARLQFCSPASFAQTKACLSATWQGPLELGERVELEAEAAAMATGDFLKAHKAWIEGQAYNFHKATAVAGRVPSAGV